MPLSDPASCRDKTHDWMSYFNASRRDVLAKLVTPELIDEYRRNPSGSPARHSPALQEVLIYLRTQAVAGKPFVYVEEPHRIYRIGRMQGRGNAPAILDDEVFSTERDAVHAVFLRRLRWLGLLADDAEAAR
jgi:branched-chain amino acid transport system permease protein